MADCVKLEKCPFFHDRLTHMPSMSEIYKENHCRGSNAECARWFVHSYLGPEAVGEDLFPNDIETARRLVREAGVTR